MSTADVARDLDLLRQAVGDDALTYLGFSYGSVLGQTYANLFPGRVRALAIDGVVDPRAWAGTGVQGRTVPVGTRLRSAESARATLGEFFRLCDEAGPECAISGGAADRYAELTDRLRVAPIELTDPFGTRVVVTRQDVVAITLGALYTPRAWPDLARYLGTAMEPASAGEVGASLATLRARLGLDERDAEQESYPNLVEGTNGVACADAVNPRSDRWYRRAADAAEARDGYFGRLWTWTWSACLRWPAQAGLDRYDGPWTARTAHPVLVVGNLYDPATGHHGAVAASRLLPSSTLLTYTGWGHTAYLAGNACVDATVTQYLLAPDAAGDDVVCEAQGSPFTSFGIARAATAASPVVTATLPESVRRALR
jgi:pimeloyl-ACP methyl ester carboxylesterase